MSTLNVQVGIRLRAARKAAGFKSARDFVKEYDIPESTYSQHETGKRSVNVETIVHYSNLLNIPPGWLLTGEGTPHGHESSKTNSLTSGFLNFSDVNSKFQPLGQTIEGKHAYVNMDVFSDVLQAIAPIFSDNEVNLSYEELIDFCIEIYNSVITTTADKNSMQSIIQLSVTSLKRGVQYHNAAAYKDISES